MIVPVRIKKLREDAFIPEYKTAGAAGFDLVAVSGAIIGPNQTCLVGTGIAVAVPAGYELQVRPRSGMAYKTEAAIKNSPGTVDSDYRGEILIMVKNNDPLRNLVIARGDRIAQGVIAPVVTVRFIKVDELPETERGAGGWGSTGMREAV